MIFSLNRVPILVICLFCLILWGETAFSSECYTPKQDNVPYYSGPRTSHRQLGILDKDAVIQGIGKEDTWLIFKKDGQDLYILLESLTVINCQTWQMRQILNNSFPRSKDMPKRN